jgi:hypothetical protein
VISLDPTREHHGFGRRQAAVKLNTDIHIVTRDLPHLPDIVDGRNRSVDRVPLK